VFPCMTETASHSGNCSGSLSFIQSRCSPVGHSLVLVRSSYPPVGVSTTRSVAQYSLGVRDSGTPMNPRINSLLLLVDRLPLPLMQLILYQHPCSSIWSLVHSGIPRTPTLIEVLWFVVSFRVIQNQLRFQHSSSLFTEHPSLLSSHAKRSVTVLSCDTNRL
jgi:hypothetical protein